MKIKTTLFAGLATLALSGVAMATPSTGSESQNQNFQFSLSPGNQTLQFDLFDDMGGTRELQMVEVFLNATIGANVLATNTSDIPAELFAVNLSGQVVVNFGGVNAIGLINQTESVPDDDLPIMPGETWDFGFVSGSDSASSSTMSNLENFVGVGTINAAVNGSGGFSISGAADSQLNVNDFGANGDVTIVYHYKMVVPAPGALALLGLAGLVGTRRRR
jgi:hypothetical protein